MMSMILPEALKKLCELQIKLRDNGGARIDDIATVQDSSYGYVLVLTSFKGNIYDEVLSAKLAEMKGKQVNPDLWVFGPFTREETPQASHPALPANHTSVNDKPLQHPVQISIPVSNQNQ